VAVEKGGVKSDGLHVYADAPTLRHIPRLNACSKRRNTLMFMHAPESLFIHAPFSTATKQSVKGFFTKSLLHAECIQQPAKRLPSSGHVDVGEPVRARSI